MEEVWNLKDVLKGKTVEELLEEAKKKVEAFKSLRKNLKPQMSAVDLKSILHLKEELGVLLTRIESYHYLKFYEKINNSKVLAKLSFLNQLFTEYNNDLLFFSLWFIDLEEKQADKFIQSPQLSDYKYYLSFLRRLKPYTKSEEIERVISLKSITGKAAFSSLFDIITGEFKFDFNNKKELSQEEVVVNYESDNASLRELAYKTVLTKYDENGVVLTEIFKNVVLDWYNEGINIRRYKHPISIRNLSNDVDDEVVETLLRVIKKNISLFSEYFKIKYELNKKSGQRYKFSRFHLYAPYKSGKKKVYNYEKSKQLVLEAYKEFDERFYKAAKEIFDQKHVHSHPQKNKKSGAFCFSLDNKSTPYILLNHSNSLRDLFTMMHEFGHGIHGVFSRKQVNLLYNASLPMAETASIFGEMILTSKILKKSKNKEEKKSVLVYLIDRNYATIIRQAYFVYFEKFAHENIIKGITKEELDEKYFSLLKEQFGEMEVSTLFKHEWNYIPHIHTSPFYCYAYAWGNLMVLSLYSMYQKQGAEFIDKYVDILSAGGGKAPINILKEAGIDPTSELFWQEGFDMIKEEIEELKRLI
ncbi:MAG: M3 family oligoendopeptidase [Nanoarchaeota archaeon]|nr:M3 family oligoendopeptidase [Nanoarchaeota archaeon]MBU1269301.1 M3 family oligoendopeptidase [Nanoarchaeota archaeon]MBU1603762.1 M3 family oligoendopeptidase [Nanoarchaeota archaeon]MBU2443887.1 M3 family oligoendopeptidase [Nanoarchaeota archaeon]